MSERLPSRSVYFTEPDTTIARQVADDLEHRNPIQSRWMRALAGALDAVRGDADAVVAARVAALTDDECMSILHDSGVGFMEGEPTPGKVRAALRARLLREEEP